MNKNVLRTLAAAAVVTAVVGAAPVSSAAPASGRNYLGTWTLVEWNVDGTVIDCPGKLTLPAPAPSIDCTGAEFLNLTKGSRYKSNLSVFEKMMHPTGDYEVVRLNNSPTRTIVFYSDSARRDPRAYNLQLSKGEDGRDRMIISLEFSAGAGRDSYIQMVFDRSAKGGPLPK